MLLVFPHRHHFLFLFHFDLALPGDTRRRADPTPGIEPRGNPRSSYRVRGMDNTPGVHPAAEAAGFWRSQLQPEARGRIVNKIMEKLKKHLPVSVPEGLIELRKIAVRFEEKIYAAATSQSDYLRKISLKMLSMESKSNTTTQQNPQNAQVVQDQSPCYLASRCSTSHTGYPGAGLKEELCQMNKTLKDQYLAGLGDLYEISLMLHGDNQMPTQKPTNLHEEVNFKLMLERSLHSLQINKRPFLDKSIVMYKRQIMSILNSEEWMPEQTFQQSAGQAPSTSSSGIRLAHGMLSPERGNVKRLRPSLEDHIHR